jgi:spore germination cell wall hydrolase CwlJ-like protein
MKLPKTATVMNGAICVDSSHLHIAPLSFSGRPKIPIAKGMGTQTITKAEVAPAVPAPLPDSSKTFAQQDPLILLAMCVWGESRGNTLAEKIGVACVVRNRLHQHWMGAHNWADVILKPWQFDCFLPNDPNSKKLLTPLKYETAAVWNCCYSVAQGVYSGAVSDNTGGAVFYFDLPIKLPPSEWGNVQETVTYGTTKFFKLT